MSKTETPASHEQAGVASGVGRAVGRASSAARAWIIAIACAAQFLVVMDVSLVTVAVPSISASLSLSDLEMSWVISAYTVAFASLLLLGGKLCDLWGVRRAFLIAGLLFAIATVAGALSTSALMLIVARALQGATAAVLAPTSLTLLQSEPDPRARLKAVAAWSATSSIGGAMGAVLGGVLLLALPWPAILLFEGAIALVMIVAGFFVVRHGSAQDSRTNTLDVIGAIALSLTIAAAIVSLIEAGTNGWSSRLLWGAAVMFVVASAVFAIRRRAAPSRSLLPPVMFSSRRLLSANGVMFVTAIACFPLWYLLSLALQSIHGQSAFATGLLFLTPSAAVALSSLLVPKLLGILRSSTLVMSGGALALTGSLLLALFSQHSLFWGAVLPSCVLALGMGTLFTTLTSAATQTASDGTEGLAAGLINTSRQVGSAVGLAIVTIAFARSGTLTTGFIAIGIAALIVLLVAPFVRRPLDGDVSATAPVRGDTQA